MSPEALCDSGLGQAGSRLMKVGFLERYPSSLSTMFDTVALLYLQLGRPSDVWSLGCILYQMVYGHTPFGRIKQLHLKINLIQDPNHNIDFPSHAIPKDAEGHERPEMAVRVEDDLVKVVKGCLRFNSKERPTIPDLLEDAFLKREGSHSDREGECSEPDPPGRIAKRTGSCSSAASLCHRSSPALPSTAQLDPHQVPRMVSGSCRLQARSGTLCGGSSRGPRLTLEYRGGL